MLRKLHQHLIQALVGYLLVELQFIQFIEQQGGIVQIEELTIFQKIQKDIPKSRKRILQQNTERERVQTTNTLKDAQVEKKKRKIIVGKGENNEI
ncbi:hypothetical protein [Vagococcus salmoninarum]|uniref:hypothetical protein n=1 Tax=Vagococcus salmoninarum TaxID=2739 RepID=UPI00187FBB70|nr:hypothetical protein [Vagococcus salmoninarum]MBE9388825.1 hypothetical protein [Vagococcus salmoninarum]